MRSFVSQSKSLWRVWSLEEREREDTPIILHSLLLLLLVCLRVCTKQKSRDPGSCCDCGLLTRFGLLALELKIVILWTRDEPLWIWQSKR